MAVAGRCVLMCLSLVLPAGALAARCVDEGGASGNGSAVSSTDAAAAAAAADPKRQLQDMVTTALTRSRAVGAARLLAEAAESDTDEVRAARAITASATAQAGYSASRQSGLPSTSGPQARVAITASQLLYDGGRNSHLVDWRSRQAEAARIGILSQQEQVAVQTVSLVVERSRYRVQTQVYQQYARKMGCLVEALEQIVATDRGRASELVQAKKTLQQAELSVAQSQSAQRLVENDLRRLLGGALPPGEGLSGVPMAVPPLAPMLAQAEQSADIRAMDRQADALLSFSSAQAAQNKPQLSWQVTTSTAAGAGNPANVGVGVAISIPLLSPGTEPSVNAARKRAEAARLQRADALEQRLSRMGGAHEQATAALDRAREIAEVLKNSDRVRNFTLQQWQQLGRRSLFDVIAAESDHYNLRVQYVNALHDGQQMNAMLTSLGNGLNAWMQ